MPRLTARERREGYLREYSYQQRTGKSFFPYALFHDVVANCFFVLLIVGLACLWYFTATARRRHQPRRQERRARPAVREPRRPGGRELRPAPRVVLLLPVRAAAAVPEPEPAAVRDDHHPDGVHGHPDRHAVHRPLARAAALPPPDRGRLRRRDGRPAPRPHLVRLEGPRSRRQGHDHSSRSPRTCRARRATR